MTKLFVLDTNVLMHDPMSLFRFEEHDICIPLMTLEELDNNKQGQSEVARNARQASRMIDEILVGCEHAINEGIGLAVRSQGEATGRLFLQTEEIAGDLLQGLPSRKADNQIIGVTMHLSEKFPKREVILVTKDINMRIKARALGLEVQDYFNDKVMEDTDLLYTGARELPADFWDTHAKDMQSWKQDGHSFYRIQGPLCSDLLVNEFVCQAGGEHPLHARVRETSGKSVVLETLTDYRNHKNAVWGIMAKNREQNFALNLLMNPDIDFVTLLGQAGTGKTLLSLAAGLVQVFEQKRYSEIIFTRVTIPTGPDIGFLPGTEEEKMLPWMGAMEDNLEVLGVGGSYDGQKDGESRRSDDWTKGVTMDLIRQRLKVKSLNFMRGRTFLEKLLIIDEAQNLTPKQMKTLITRAGPGTKVVCLGNIAQIDTPYLTEGSSGLTYVVERFRGWPHSGHITLQRGERSRLADYAVLVL
ncbi:MAG: PhoH family protein [Candidatus Moraniibacteriota bacterium]